MNVRINTENYELDMKKAEELGLLKRSFPLQAGDVYTHKGARNPLVLIRAIWPEDERCWQLSAWITSPNSDPFFWELHALDEIKHYLFKHNYTYATNIGLALRSVIPAK